MIKSIFRWVMALLYIAAGLNHFRDPDFYRPLMPPYLPWPMALIYISGVAEAAGGIGVLLPRYRRMAGWGLIVLLLAILPANIHGALHGFRNVPAAILWWRLPLQFVLIAWVWWTCLQRSRSPDHPIGGTGQDSTSSSR